MIERVISGGQTGADQGGLRAARACGIPTGGWCPKGWLTEVGPAPWLGSEYGLKEHYSAYYPDRTYENIEDSDFTLWFGNLGSSGYRCTLWAVRRNINCRGMLIVFDGLEWLFPESVVDRIRPKDIRVINIAGNRESRSPGIGVKVERYLGELFRLLKESST